MNIILNLIRQIWDKLFILLGVFLFYFPQVHLMYNMLLAIRVYFYMLDGES